ncbi:MAG: hypothetical protein ACRC9Q_04235 [Bacteroidales bacterium]
MKKEHEIKASEATRKAFKLPDNYFEQLNESVMSHIPDSEPVFENETTSLWKRILPVIYMAAMFMSIIFSVKLFIGNKPETKAQTEYSYTQADEYVSVDSTYEESLDEYTVASMDDYSLMETYAMLTSL